jgi:hypothetical protein
MLSASEVILERLSGPNVIAVEGVVLPAERHDVGKQIIADNLTLETQLGYSAKYRTIQSLRRPGPRTRQRHCHC